jgi:hypothetical protein
MAGSTQHDVTGDRLQASEPRRAGAGGAGARADQAARDVGTPGGSRPGQGSTGMGDGRTGDLTGRTSDRGSVEGRTGLTDGTEETGPGADAGVTSGSRATGTGANLDETEAAGELPGGRRTRR